MAKDANAIKPEPVLRGILDSDYATNKQALMALINELRADGAALEVE